MAGGGGGPDTQNVVQTNLPEYARPFYERLMGRSEAVSNQQYTPYQGPRIAGFTPDQQASFDLARTGTQQSQGLMGLAAQGLPSQYQAGNYNPDLTPGSFTTQGVTPQQVAAQQVTAGQVGPAGAFGAGEAEQYMSPYVSNVLDEQLARLTRRSQEQGVLRSGERARAGAFGGYRHAVGDALAERDLNEQVNTLEAQGLQDAYLNAQQQYERDRSARIGVEQFNVDQGLRGLLANQQTGLQADLANQQAGLTAGQFNSAQALEAQRLGDQSRLGFGQLGLSAFTQNQGAAQAAEELRQRGLTSQAQVAQGLAGLVDQDYQRLQGIGLQQQQQEQGSLDLAYQDFINQRDYDMGQLSWLSNILQGVPVTPQSATATYTNPNPYSQALGLGVNALALQDLMGGQGG